MGNKLFDYVIGNPPYQEDVKNSGDRANPVYNKFMDAAYGVADCVELIHPARFLFNAGQTPKAWNKKMLSDTHFKVLKYEPDASKVFPNTDIKGGVAVTLYDERKDFGEIGTFIANPELNSIDKKVTAVTNVYLDSIVSSRGMYRFTEKFYLDYPNAGENVGSGTGNMIVSNIFEKLNEIFQRSPLEDDVPQVAIVGRIKNSREKRYIKAEYVVQNEFLPQYNMMVAKSSGTGRFGEAFGDPFVLAPNEGATDTYISIGHFESEAEANTLVKYLHTKFFRTMLGVNKVTQDNPKSVWRSIPLQDFTPSSDIDWSKSIHEIDLQLYRKYGLDEKEIEFIETHVKEMA